MAVSCNCSICMKKGALLRPVPDGQFRVTAGREPGRYLFHNRVIAHRFCAACARTPMPKMRVRAASGHTM